MRSMAISAVSLPPITHGIVVDSAVVDEGSIRVIIHKVYASASPNGVSQVMEAIIYVNPGGKVTLASFGRAKAIK